MMKKLFGVLVPILLAALAVGSLVYSLRNYAPHMEVELLALFVSLICVAVNVFLLIFAGTIKNFAMMAAAALSAFVCLAVFLIARKIPLCPICDEVTAQDLGFLARWIPLGP